MSGFSDKMTFYCKDCVFTSEEWERIKKHVKKTGHNMTSDKTEL